MFTFRLAARIIVAAVIGVGVFLASMALTLVIRGESSLAAGAPLTSQPVSEASTEPIAPIRSTESVVVATTTPSTPVVVTTTTIDIPTRTRSAPLPELDDVFAPLIPDLEASLLVPVRMPAELEVPGGTLTADGVIDSAGYTIHVDQQDACQVGSTCRIATFTARQSVLSQPVLGTRGTSVPLPNGITGRFSDGTCGLGCNNAFITWIEDGVRYSVGSSTISGSEVLDLAWRSIDRSLAAPNGPEVCGPGNPKHDGQVTNVLTTEVVTGEEIHWVAVCSDLGIDVEILATPGTMRWADVDRNGEHEVVVAHADGSTTIFAVDENRPRAIIDLGTSERLRVSELACTWFDGENRVIDAATSEELSFISPLTVARIALDTEAADQPRWNC